MHLRAALEICGEPIAGLAAALDKQWCQVARILDALAPLEVYHLLMMTTALQLEMVLFIIRKWPVGVRRAFLERLIEHGLIERAWFADRV